ncbi:crossover junction endonuclease EME1 [Euwallacea similis]|uniref:crossover junction endonuclease EME1 n=1 Tax=Euwallacea similis TaxID=1736056 RepID=UPI00344BC845
MDKDIIEVSTSENTILIDHDGINYLQQKTSSDNAYLPKTVSPPRPCKSLYTLDDFSDIEDDYVCLKTRICNKLPQKTASWTNKFSPQDFCHDSNDFDCIITAISQSKSSRELEQESNKRVLKGDVMERPQNETHKADDEGLSMADFRGLELLKTKRRENLVAIKTTGSLDLEDAFEPRCKIKKKCGHSSEIENNRAHKKMNKELIKAVKAQERELKKVEKENLKELKKALKIIDNSAKPDQCVQHLTVNLDDNLQKKTYGEAIIMLLQSKAYNYQISKQCIPNLITFTRRVFTVENMVLNTNYQQEKHCVTVIELPELLELISQDTLIGHIQSLQSMPGIEHLSVAILGLQKYYNTLRTEQNRNLKRAVAGSSNHKTVKTQFENLPKISKWKIDNQLVQLQIFCKNLYLRPVEKYEELAIFVGECAKSVAQIPFKSAKEQFLQSENQLFTVNNRDCVRIDKDGNGLNRLWNQFLRMFPLASLETAEAITLVYPTLHSLMEAYENCREPEEGEKLLQNISVRRAAGPLSGQKKLGPALSKKIYKMFNSLENVSLKN